MPLLNVSFGIIAFLPHGWLFMLAIILLECLAFSYLLLGRWKKGQIYVSVGLANFISGVVGILTSLAVSGGWWLVVWFPWVSSAEVREGDFILLTFYYLIAFVLSVLIEGIVNWSYLRKDYPAKDILIKTLQVNLLSYFLGSFLMYSYSFSN